MYRSFPKGTSCGRDGMRAQHLLDAVGGEGSVTSSGLLASITEVVNLWLGRSCPKVLAEFVASAPLTPLLKPDKGIRPIAVGGIWRRLVSKVAMKKVGKEMTQYLSDYQFGVGVPNGAEAVLHSANRFLNSFHADGSLALLTVDFSNAFNTVDRTTFLKRFISVVRQSIVRKLNCLSTSFVLTYLPNKKKCASQNLIVAICELKEAILKLSAS
ncbi:hypothetical protein E3N88_02577 [Mikania micrantha]|uniref:Reverse transcriptase domain-containing protein n=1 Tax=Mikania micrantha TaxID=192012 RepID=A0A5N6Q661_9ASTR|nr:hypothetical protein E3N88_02577 [Mikania micrantha]